MSDIRKSFARGSEKYENKLFCMQIDKQLQKLSETEKLYGLKLVVFACKLEIGL